MFRKTLLLLCALTASVLNAQVKVATVDMAKLFDGYTKAQSVEASIKSDIQKASKEIQRRSSEGKALADQLIALQQKISNQTLSTDARNDAKKQATALENTLDQKRQEFEKYQAQARQALAEKESTQRQTIYNEIQNATIAVARKTGANLVVNTSEKTTAGGLPAVVYADSNWDITDAVLKTLNAGSQK